MQVVVLVAVFLSVCGLLIGVYTLLNRRELAMRSAARSRLEPEAATDAAKLIMREEEAASALPFLNRLLAGRGLTDELANRLHRAGVSMNAATFILITGVLGALGVLLGSRVGLIGRLAGFIIGVLIPMSWLAHKTRKRQQAFEHQLPDAIDMLVSALKSGYSFHAATNFLGQELGEPLGPEFQRMYDEQRLGIEARQALLIQRETGGNLSEVLTNTGQVMRERVAVRGALETLTAEAKLSARLLALLPVAVFFALSFISPEFTGAFTASRTGQLMLLGAAVSVATGYSIMMKIANIEY